MADIFTNLGRLLPSLGLREGGRGGLLAGFGRLSLRKEDISYGSSLNSKEPVGWHIPAHQRHESSSHIFITCLRPCGQRNRREKRRSKRSAHKMEAHEGATKSSKAISIRCLPFWPRC